MTADERYRTEAKFAHLVDLFHDLIRKLEFTPTEIREAAMLAQIKYEMFNPRQFKLSPKLYDEIIKGMEK